MKIAVLTLRLHTNYGGILQAYALMEILKRMGHDPYLVNVQYFKKRNVCSRYFLYLKNAIKKYGLGKKNIEIFRERRYRKEYNVVYQKITPFIDRNIIPKTDFICSEEDWKGLQSKYNFEAYIVGSDQVWRPAYSNNVMNYFLAFLKDQTVRRISYAASFGTSEWEFLDVETKQCASLLKNFDAVSVREDSAIAQCSIHLGVNPVLVLDPTLLLLKEDYIALISQKVSVNSPKQLLVYILDSDNRKERLISLFETQQAMCRFSVNNDRVENKQIDLVERIAPPVAEWLYGFSVAKYVITDSFHACVFSIIFHVPFCVVGNSARGLARFQSLLSLFGLEDRLLDLDLCEEGVIPTTNEIDWKKVDRKLQEMRTFSIDFLKNALIKEL